MTTIPPEAFERLAAAKAVAVLTGAGISAESGVPTFRGAGGLWRNYRATDLATPEAFADDPHLVWEWYDWRRGLVGPLEPNPAHKALVRLEQAVGRFTLVTQNVDGLHALAGSQNIIELHGNLYRRRCLECGETQTDRTHPLDLLPTCPSCGGVERPDIVWFGEALPPGAMESSAAAVATADVLLIIGTSGLVYPAAGLAAIGRRAGTWVALINLEDNPQSSACDLTLLGKAGDLVPRLVDGAFGGD